MPGEVWNSAHLGRRGYQFLNKFIQTKEGGIKYYLILTSQKFVFFFNGKPVINTNTQLKRNKRH